MHNIVGYIGESRWVSWHEDKQFKSFFPGDIFLGLMTAGLLAMALNLTDRESWYNSTGWHVVVLASALGVAGLLTYNEWKEGQYPTRAIFSPTKLYHNFVLYGGYGYVIVTTLVAVSADVLRSWLDVMVFVACLVPGVYWAKFVIDDAKLDPEILRVKSGNAHVADWRPIWSQGRSR